MIHLYQTIEHPKYGKGVVQSEWGSWKACRTCYIPWCDKHRHIGAINQKGERIWHYEINGENIFDVLFESGELRSLHLCSPKCEACNKAKKMRNQGSFRPEIRSH